MNTKWLKLGLGYFFMVALLGTLMRFGLFSGYMPVDYKNILHAHSHLGFLGWLYPVLFISIINTFIDNKDITKGKYNIQFFITQLLLFSMFFSFILQGYGVVSIILTTTFQFMTYWFVFSFFRDYKKNNIQLKYSTKFIKTGLISLIVSSLGTWSLAVIGAKGLIGTTIYELAVYFYLHFQYNGWFTFSVLGLFLSLLEKNNIIFPEKYALTSHKLLAYTILPTYLLSVLGKVSGHFINEIAFISGTIQIVGAGYFIAIIYSSREKLNQLFNKYIKGLMTVSATSFFLKTILQTMSAIPLLTDIAFNNRFVVIAYIHMVFIGFISLFIFGYLSHLNIYSIKSSIAKTGVGLLISGFSITEVLLISPAFNILIPDLSLLIFLFSAIMLIGILLFITAQFNLKTHKKPLLKLQQVNLPVR